MKLMKEMLIVANTETNIHKLSIAWIYMFASLNVDDDKTGWENLWCTWCILNMGGCQICKFFADEQQAFTMAALTKLNNMML